MRDAECGGRPPGIQGKQFELRFGALYSGRVSPDGMQDVAEAAGPRDSTEMIYQTISSSGRVVRWAGLHPAIPNRAVRLTGQKFPVR